MPKVSSKEAKPPVVHKSKKPLVGEWDKWVTLSQALALDGRIPAHCKALYWIIACYRSQKSGLAWPSHKTIAGHADLTEPTARKYLDELEQWGLVERYKAEGSQESIRYRLLPYSQAVHIHHMRDLGRTKSPLKVRKEGGKGFTTIRDDSRWKKLTPKPETAQSLKNHWQFHSALCQCSDCSTLSAD
jgi:DNA-binding MarR family transcriptional regulator